MDELDKVFNKLKKWSYGELQNTLLSKYGHLFMINDHSQEIIWPPGHEEIIKESGWTENELVKFVENYKGKE